MALCAFQWINLGQLVHPSRCVWDRWGARTDPNPFMCQRIPIASTVVRHRGNPKLHDAIHEVPQAMQLLR